MRTKVVKFMFGEKWRRITLLLALAVLAPAFLPLRAHAASTPRVTFKYGNADASIASLAYVDVNGDGRKDFVLGAVCPIEFTAPLVCDSYVVFNTPSMPTIVDLTNLGELGYKITTSEFNRSEITLGVNVVDAGDVQGSGKHAIIFTVYSQETDRDERAYLVFGKSDTSTVDINHLTQSQGVYISGQNPGDSANLRFAALGDVNGDGKPDLGVADLSYTNGQIGCSNCGKINIVFGRSTWPSSISLDTLTQDGSGYSIFGKANSYSGTGIGAAGDVNGDGLADIILTTQESDLPNTPSAAYVVFGSSGAVDVKLSQLGSQGFRMYSNFHLQTSSMGTTGVGDVNSDGLGDVAIGGNGQPDHGGTAVPPKIWIVHGKTDSTDVNLDSLGSGGTTISSNNTFTSFGQSIGTDSNYIVTADMNVSGPSNESNSGEVFAFPKSALGSSIQLPDLAGGYGVQGATDEMSLGYQFASGSDHGELLAAVGNGNSPFVAAVVPASSAVVQMPNNVLPPPTGLMATTPTNKAPVISWDAVSGANHYNIYRDNSPVLVGSSTGTSFTDSSVSTSGSYAYTVTAVDGNNAESAQSTTLTLAYDIDPPNVSNLSLSPVSISAGGSASLTASISDNLTNASTAEYFTGTDPGQGNGSAMTVTNGTASATVGSNLSTGIYDLNVRAKDGAGNWSAPQSVQLTVRVAVPSGLAAATPTEQPSLTWNGVSGADHYNVYRDGVNIGSTITTGYFDNAAADGNHTYEVTAVDLLGSESAKSAAITVLVDDVAPTVSYKVSPGPTSDGWNKSTVTITFTCSDPIDPASNTASGVASCPSTTSVSAQGITDLSVSATDNAGNTTTTQVTEKIDEMNPTISYSLSPSPASNGWNYSSPVTVTFNCADPADPVSNTSSGVSSCPSPVTVSASGSTSVPGTVVDKAGNSASTLATVNIDLPPNVGAPSGATLNEGDTFSQNGSFTDSDSSSWSATVDYGDGSGSQPLSLSGTNYALSHVYKDQGTYSVSVAVTDNQAGVTTKTATVTVNNVAPTIGSITTVPPTPVQTGTAITASASFTDPGVLDSHSASWNWGDGNTSPGSVTEASGSGSVSNQHTYSTAGVFEITLTVTDKDGASTTQKFDYLSVYSPTSQGIFSAGEIFTSPVEAYGQNPNLTGNVQFGLSYKYQGTLPSGNRAFTMDFNAANFHFNATSVGSLVVDANNIATLTGTGSLTGHSGTYSFTVVGSQTANTVRIQIKDPSGNVVYDTQPEAAITASPAVAVTGQVIAHQ